MVENASSCVTKSSRAERSAADVRPAGTVLALKAQQNRTRWITSLKFRANLKALLPRRTIQPRRCFTGKTLLRGTSLKMGRCGRSSPSFNSVEFAICRNTHRLMWQIPVGSPLSGNAERRSSIPPAFAEEFTQSLICGVRNFSKSVAAVRAFRTAR